LTGGFSVHRDPSDKPEGWADRMVDKKADKPKAPAQPPNPMLIIAVLCIFCSTAIAICLIGAITWKSVVGR